MKEEYFVNVKETLEREVRVCAAGYPEAERKIRKQWEEGSIVLTADDFRGVEFCQAVADGAMKKGDENKQAILDSLLQTLRLTRQMYDIVSMGLLPGNDELVEVVFANGGKKIANIAGDSGYAMIRDIMKQIA